jgi:hypothetical protein
VIATAQGDSYSLILLEDDGVSILVDLRLCLASSEGRVEAFLPAIKSTVSVMGYVESLSEVRLHSLWIQKLKFWNRRKSRASIRHSSIRKRCSIQRSMSRLSCCSIDKV